ncbi:MAG: putative metal-binding motif-containing protein, partial [Myxococcales bacterium]|nr:putative metal-binding motif-containing protein [Myxococcales bacterium]
DDGDPRRYPGNTEICDSVGRDEDCNWEPFGPEADGDGHSPAICCNLAPDGSLRCGADCDDTSAEINPDAPESCNGVDDDCDGVIDEGDLSAACGGIAYSIHGCVAGAYDGTVDFDGTVLATDPDSHAFLLRLDP